MLPDRRPPRLTRLLRQVRRAVLRRRRLLAALLAAVATAAGLRAATAPPPPTEPVVVAARDLPAGGVLRPEDLTVVQHAAGSAPAGTVDDPAGRLLASPLRRGEPVTDVRLLGPGLADGHPGLVAVPVRLPDAGMVGLLQVGDVIDLVAADPQGAAPRQVADDVPVLALPAATEDAGVNGLGGRLVVIGALPAEVPAVADAGARAYLTFAWAP